MCFDIFKMENDNLCLFFVEQIKMEYIVQMKSDSPRTRHAKSDKSLKVCTITRHLDTDATTKKINNYMTPIQRSGCLHQS